MALLSILLIFTTILDITSARKETCDLHAAVGIRLALPFVFESVIESEKVVWWHNSTVIYQQDKGKVSVGKPEDINHRGSLVLINPKLASAGDYEAKVYNLSGAELKTWKGFLCVMEKVPKPTLSYSCDQKSVMFKCDTDKSQDLRYTWKMDDKVLAGETRVTLTLALSQLKSKNRFFCCVSNLVSNEISGIVSPVCNNPAATTQNLLCFRPQLVFAGLAGGVGVIIILVVAIVVLGCHRRRNTIPKRRDKKSFSPQPQPDTDYETMTVPKDSPEPELELSLRADHQESVHEAEAAGDSRVDPSPVPKPRTKRTNTQDL
ncbi:unnamed protein product [Knipowitschia caucasica]